MTVAAPPPSPIPAPDLMLPRPFRIRKVRRELADTFTLVLAPDDGGAVPAFLPGQFNMLYVPGVGEVPISISGDPAQPGELVHTTRAVGAVTKAMWRLKAGQVLGVRGPFGSAWPVEPALGDDVVIVAGGIGLAPLRPLVHAVLGRRAEFGKVLILYGARTPDDILFDRQLRDWRGRFDLSVHVTVDRATGAWSGNVGVVTTLIRRGGFDPHHTTAYICGPEVMMRYAADALVAKGVASNRIWLSMERNMKCAIGVCGHCQWGGRFVCKDGPVFNHAAVADVLPLTDL